jgi:hypothetical protein
MEGPSVGLGQAGVCPWRPDGPSRGVGRLWRDQPSLCADAGAFLLHGQGLRPLCRRPRVRAVRRGARRSASQAGKFERGLSDRHPPTPSTLEIISNGVIDALPQGAFFVLTTRMAVVEQKALWRRTRAGEIAAGNRLSRLWRPAGRVRPSQGSAFLVVCLVMPTG